MINSIKKKFICVLLGLMFILTTNNVLAQTCSTPPSCSDIGFTKTATDCVGKTILKCPFDTNQVYCPGYEESTRKYNKGDTYVSANGVGAGTVVKVDSSGLHGIVVASGGAGSTATEVGAFCQSKTSGGLEWALIDRANADLYGDTTIGCPYCFTTEGCCQICSSSVKGSCHDGYCDGGLCEAVF